MSMLRKGLFYVVVVLSTVLIVCGLLSLIHDVSYWYSKILDFPRVQYLIGSLVCLGLFSLLNQRWKLPAIALALGLLASIGIQSAFILPYYLGDRPVAEANAGGEASVGIMIANVLISNRSSEPFLEMVRARDPDMLLVMEVNDWWMEQLAPLDRDYAHVIEFPTDNAYGMALYSKFPLDESQIKFFNHDDVPSIHAGVALPSGRKFRFHGMHPVAPVPSKEYPDNRGEKEVALGKVAAMVAQDSLPAIVAGDLNDVSWSNTARLFEQESKLNNVRLGRGLYNSFDATSPFLRWPLDHYFVHGDFSLLKLERLPKFGSDHFPMYAEFVLK